jgi:hypothetical protein
MTTEKAIRIMAGLFILLSLALGVEGSPVFVARGWLWFTAFVGANLFQSALTGFCPAELVLRWMGMKRAGEAGS